MPSDRPDLSAPASEIEEKIAALRRQIEELRSVLGDVAAALAAPAPQRVQVEMDAAVEAAVEAAAEVGARRAFDGQTFTTTITAN